MTPARLAAARALVAVERGSTTLSSEIERARPAIADPRDAALLMELASGTTRWRNALDARLAPHLRHPLDTLAPEIRAILRLATYQIHHLDRVPDHAVVNESVELTRVMGQPRAAGFVNAVLRNLLRGRQRAAALPERPADPHDTARALDYLSIALSHPRWLVARWLERVGLDACERWCRFNNASPELTLRPLEDTTDALVRRLRDEGIEASPGSYVKDAVRIPAGALGRIPPDLRSRVLIQDEGSQLVACVAGTLAGERVLDVCAAPGGKTVILAGAVGPQGVVIAGDRRPARVRLLQSTLLRAQIHAPVLTLDAQAGLPFQATFDRVLLDAPCSGLGTIRRDPDIKWNRQESDVTRFASSQLVMLAHAAHAVRPGGSLIYSTCSSEPEENEQVVDAFLASAPDFTLAPLAGGQPSSDAAPLFDELGRLHTWPFVHGLDAFFAARLVRRERA